MWKVGIGDGGEERGEEVWEVSVGRSDSHLVAHLPLGVEASFQNQSSGKRFHESLFGGKMFRLFFTKGLGTVLISELL